MICALMTFFGFPGFEELSVQFNEAEALRAPDVSEKEENIGWVL